MKTRDEFLNWYDSKTVAQYGGDKVPTPDEIYDFLCPELIGLQSNDGQYSFMEIGGHRYRMILDESLKDGEFIFVNDSGLKK